MVAGELAVITKAKDVCNYIITVTDKSPKKFRFTLIRRMQNYALDIIEGMIMANEVYVTEKGQSVNIEALKERQKLQRNVLKNIKLLAYVSQLSMEQKCILPKQYEQITEKLYTCQNLLGAWIKSDLKRFGK